MWPSTYPYSRKIRKKVLPETFNSRILRFFARNECFRYNFLSYFPFMDWPWRKKIWEHPFLCVNYTRIHMYRYRYSEDLFKIWLRYVMSACRHYPDEICSSSFIFKRIATMQLGNEGRGEAYRCTSKIISINYCTSFLNMHYASGPSYNWYSREHICDWPFPLNRSS